MQPIACLLGAPMARRVHSTHPGGCDRPHLQWLAVVGQLPEVKVCCYGPGQASREQAEHGGACTPPDGPTDHTGGVGASHRQ